MTENRKNFQLLKSLLAILWSLPLHSRDHKVIARSVNRVQQLDDSDLFGSRQKSKDIKPLQQRLSAFHSDFKGLFLRFIKRLTKKDEAVAPHIVEQMHPVARNFWYEPDKFKVLKLYQLAMRHEQEVLQHEMNPA